MGTELGPRVLHGLPRRQRALLGRRRASTTRSLRAGALYPPIAANLTILLFQTVAPRPMIQAAQRLVCHRRGEAGSELTVRGVVTERYEKRAASTP